MNRPPARYDLLACNLALASVAALLCVIHNRLDDGAFGRTLTSVVSWLATIAAFTFFVLTLALAPIALAVEVGL